MRGVGESAGVDHGLVPLHDLESTRVRTLRQVFRLEVPQACNVLQRYVAGRPVHPAVAQGDLLAPRLQQMSTERRDSRPEDLARGGTRYSRHRILAIARGMERGEQFGRAMEGSGHGFPAPELIPVVMALDGMDSWTERLGRFVDRWVDRSERSVQERAVVVNRALTMVVVLIVGSGMWLLFGVLQDLIGQAL